MMLQIAEQLSYRRRVEGIVKSLLRKRKKISI